MQTADQAKRELFERLPGLGARLLFVFFTQQTLFILSGQTQQVIAQLRSLTHRAGRPQAQRTALETAANFFQRNVSCMHYHHYRA